MHPQASGADFSFFVRGLSVPVSAALLSSFAMERIRKVQIRVRRNARIVMTPKGLCTSFSVIKYRKDSSLIAYMMTTAAVKMMEAAPTSFPEGLFLENASFCIFFRFLSWGFLLYRYPASSFLLSRVWISASSLRYRKEVRKEEMAARASMEGAVMVRKKFSSTKRGTASSRENSRNCRRSTGISA